MQPSIFWGAGPAGYLRHPLHPPTTGCWHPLPLPPPARRWEVSTNTSPAEAALHDLHGIFGGSQILFRCNFPNDYHIESVALGVPHCFEHVFRSCPSCHHVSWKFSSAGFSVNAPHVTPATPISFSGNMMFEAGGHESQHKLLMLTWHLHLNIPLHSRQPNNPLWRSSTPQQNRHQQGLGLSPEKVDASSVALLGL